MILLDATYINVSGGKVLLEYFIKNIQEKKIISNFFFLLDERLESEYVDSLSSKQYTKITNSEGKRKRFYQNLPTDITRIFCFGNIPPPIKVDGKDVFILFHNALLLTNGNAQYNLKTRLIYGIKKLYIKKKAESEYRWIVQTKYMSNLLAKVLTIPQSTIEILPFYEENRFKGLNKQLQQNKNQFLYVADGVKQKNHLSLLKAWEVIYDKKKLPITLHLTIPPNYILLINEVIRLQSKGISIINHGFCNFAELEDLYRTCNYFINPSLAESFGLPLIEAAEAGCEIISADLEYVYEVIKPMATFDPYNSSNIAKTIMDVYDGSYLTKTDIIVKNKIQELIKLIHNDI